MSGGITGGRNTREEEKVEKREKKQNTKGCEVSASLLSTFSTLAAAQIYRLFILHQVSALNEKKKKNHIQVNDKTYNRRHDLRVIYKVPFRFNGVRKRRERERETKHKKENIFFFVRNVLLYIQWQSQLFSQTPAHAHSFILVLLISNTSVKCNTYIYLYIMKELKNVFFQEQFTAL